MAIHPKKTKNKKKKKPTKKKRSQVRYTMQPGGRGGTTK